MLPHTNWLITHQLIDYTATDWLHMGILPNAFFLLDAKFTHSKTKVQCEPCILRQRTTEIKSSNILIQIQKLFFVWKKSKRNYKMAPFQTILYNPEPDPLWAKITYTHDPSPNHNPMWSDSKNPDFGEHWFFFRAKCNYVVRITVRITIMSEERDYSTLNNESHMNSVNLRIWYIRE